MTLPCVNMTRQAFYSCIRISNLNTASTIEFNTKDDHGD